jgi:hypothetical protein
MLCCRSPGPGLDSPWDRSFTTAARLDRTCGAHSGTLDTNNSEGDAGHDTSRGRGNFLVVPLAPIPTSMAANRDQ